MKNGYGSLDAVDNVGMLVEAGGQRDPTELNRLDSAKNIAKGKTEWDRMRMHS